jgi:hypothetical protein
VRTFQSAAFTLTAWTSTTGRNRATAEARAAAEATGILPLDYMLSVMRDAHAEPKRRDAMAMAAAPYLHPRLSSVEAARAEQPSSAEKYGIRVEFVRPRPRPEDDKNSDAGLAGSFVR